MQVHQVQGLVCHVQQHVHGQVGGAEVVVGAAGGVQGVGPQSAGRVVVLDVVGHLSGHAGQFGDGHQQPGADLRRADGALQSAHLV